MAPRKGQGKGRRADKKGRSKTEGRFLKLEHFMLKSAAWKSLTSQQRSIYIEIGQRYNGSNNGEISFSVRQAASEVNCSRDTASKALHVLEEKGFIRRNVCGSFDWKARHATTWILTIHPFKNNLATKEFMSWRAPNLKANPNRRPGCPKSGPVNERINGFSSNSGLHLGPKH